MCRRVNKQVLMSRVSHYWINHTHIHLLFCSYARNTTSQDSSNTKCLTPNVSLSSAESDCPAVEVFVTCVWCVFGSAASSKTISGLLEFDSKTHAVEVLTVLNHYQIRIPSESATRPADISLDGIRI